MAFFFDQFVASSTSSLALATALSAAGTGCSLKKVVISFNISWVPKLDAINIAPEFGMIETKVILNKLKVDNNIELIDKFYKLCFDSKKWIKWVSKDFKPEENKEKLIEICGHYVFAKKEFFEIKNNYTNIDDEIQRVIYDRLVHIHDLVHR